MAILTFTDFEAYADSVAGVEGQMRVTGRGQGDWTLELLDAGDVIAMLGVDGAPMLYRGLSDAGRYHAYITLPGSDAYMQGHQATDEVFIWFAPGTEVHGVTRVASRFIVLDLAAGAVIARASEVAGLVDGRLDRTHPVRVGREEINQLITLVVRALKIYRRRPHLFEVPMVRRAFSGQVIHALLRCMTLGSADDGRRSRGRPIVSRNEIISRSVQHIQRSIRGEAAIGELTLSARTSQRSLNRAFDEIFGMGPQQYYMIERLHVIRRSLREARPGDTVTLICSRFGVWDLGRFAGMYRKMFGIHPSIELAAALEAGRSRGALRRGR
jgi:AraC family ethanolamine operon transcriptional activator